MTQPSPISSGFVSPTRPGQGESAVKPEAPACTLRVPRGGRIPLPESSADLHSTRRDQNHPGRNSATGCRHWGGGRTRSADGARSHKPLFLRKPGSKAQPVPSLSHRPFSFQRLLPSPHPPEHQPTPPFLHQKKRRTAKQRGLRGQQTPNATHLPTADNGR